MKFESRSQLSWLITKGFPCVWPVTDATHRNCVAPDVLEWKLVIDVLNLVPPVSIVPLDARYPYGLNPSL
jgi:hypothetical protein